MSDRPVKLHLGCGKRFIPGFVHVDTVAFPHIDHVQDIRALPQFEENSVELIYACQVLTYFDREEVVDVLAEWRRVLKPGGILRLSVINFETIVRLYNDGFPLERFLGWLYGKWTDDRGGFVYERTTYDLPSMTTVLTNAGFEHVELWDWRTTEHAEVDDYSQAYIPHMDKENGLLVNLNIQARKP